MKPQRRQRLWNNTVSRASSARRDALVADTAYQKNHRAETPRCAPLRDHQPLKAYLLPLLRDALRSIGAPEDTEIVLEIPRATGRGNLVTPVALSLARQLRKSPHTIAKEIVAHLAIDPEQIAEVELADSGFINISFSPGFHHSRLDIAARLGRSYGRSDAGQGIHAKVRCASTDPAIPLQPAQYRNTALCDAIVNLLEWTGHKVAYSHALTDRRVALVVESFAADDTTPRSDISQTIRTIPHGSISFVEGGRPTQLSKQTGRALTLNNLNDELGAEVVRFFCIMQGAAPHLEFDLDRAREHSGNNPLFYLQYAHAQIAGVLRHAASAGISLEADAMLSPLCRDEELALIRQILLFPDIVARAARELSPAIVAGYLRDLTAAFHSVYRTCRIVIAPPALRSARLRLLQTTGTVIASGLGLLGICAPDRV